MKQGYHTNEDRRSTIVRKSSLPSYYGKNNVTHSEHNNFKLMGEFLFRRTCTERKIASISITSSRSISKLLPLHSRNLLVKRNSVNMRGKGGNCIWQVCIDYFVFYGMMLYASTQLGLLLCSKRHRADVDCRNGQTHNLLYPTTDFIL